MKEAVDKAAVLIEALPYIEDFRGSVILVKVGGSVMEVPENLDCLLSDIAFLNVVGIKTILVHGGGKAISRGMEKAGIPPLFVMGLRVTTEETVRVVEQVIKNEVNANVVRTRLWRDRFMATGSFRLPRRRERIRRPGRS
jgi:acetylglutamate kinase